MKMKMRKRKIYRKCKLFNKDRKGNLFIDYQRYITVQDAIAKATKPYNKSPHYT